MENENQKQNGNAEVADGFDIFKGKQPGNSSNLAREYYDSLLISMRYIDSVPASTKIKIYGHTFNSPISITSISHLAAFGYGESAMVEIARAAKELNIINFVGAGSEEELESVINTGAKTIKIVKPYADHELIFNKIKHAEQAGAIAVGMDVDHIFNRVGGYDNLDGIPLSDKSLDDIKTFVKATKLPFIVKGILSVSDAEKCLEAGAQGIFLSHHHGLHHFMTPPAMMLPKIVEAVGGKMQIFVDGNVESAYDAFKALALGATAVAVGRPLVKMVKKEGEMGVKKWLEKANCELAGIMSRSGCADVDSIDSTHILKKEHLF